MIEEDTSITGEDRGVPTIHHPSPAALAVIQEYLEHKRLRLLDLFAQADKDKNWAVSRQEFRNIIRSWKIPLTEADLEDLIIALDRDNSDALDYRELAVGRQSYLEERSEISMHFCPSLRSTWLDIGYMFFQFLWTKTNLRSFKKKKNGGSKGASDHESTNNNFVFYELQSK